MGMFSQDPTLDIRSSCVRRDQLSEINVKKHYQQIRAGTPAVSGEVARQRVKIYVGEDNDTWNKQSVK